MVSYSTVQSLHHFHTPQHMIDILCHGVNIVDFISRSNFGFT